MLTFVLYAFSTKGYLSGILFLLIAVAVNPLFTNFLESRNINIKKIIYIPVMVVAFFVSILLCPTTEKKAEDAMPIESSEQVESDTLLITRNTPIEQEQTEQEQVILETAETTEQDTEEQERLAQEKAEQERLAQEQAEQERLAKEKEEQERLAQEKAEQERIAKEKEEQERLAKEKAEQERLAKEKEEKEKATQSQSGNGGGNGDNFNKYDNAEQQKTEDKWVLNTKSMKIHYPSCNDVKKIAPENYSTSSLSLDELKKQKYTTCGHCFK